MVGLPFTIRQLEVFETLCKNKSFRMASEELGISQAAVSNQIKALEEQLGVRLLSRESGKRPRLTNEGAAFLADLGVFWNTTRTLAAHRSENMNGHTEVPRQLHVMIGTYLLSEHVRPRLSSFFGEYPSIQLDFSSPIPSILPRGMIEREAYDLGMFLDPPGLPMAAGMREIAKIRCGVYGHRNLLGGGKRYLEKEELGKLPFLLPPAGTPYDNLVLTMLARHGVKPGMISGRTPYPDVMSDMFDRGGVVGVTLGPMIGKEHANVVMLYPLEDWRVIFYRNPRAREDDVQLQLAEDFLISSVVDDPAYRSTSLPQGPRLELDSDEGSAI